MKKSELIKILEGIEEDIDVCTLFSSQSGLMAFGVKSIKVKEAPFWDGNKKAIVIE